jgi:phytanoyl-CoA hydroxylase
MDAALSDTPPRQFETEGYLILRGWMAPDACESMLAVAKNHLRRALPPLEYEAQVGYPGAPASLDAPGGATVRRLRNAYQRHDCFRRWAEHRGLIAQLAQLLGEDVCLTLAHHNCIMTKHPRYGSATGWHRDIRYWSFARPDLITVWLALVPETETNGALRFIPGSHRMDIPRARLDALDFLRSDVAENHPLFARGKVLELAQGDAVLFHSGLFHAAGRNMTSATKFSLAFAYRGDNNKPLPGTKSAAAGDIFLGR